MRIMRWLFLPIPCLYNRYVLYGNVSFLCEFLLSGCILCSIMLDWPHLSTCNDSILHIDVGSEAEIEH